MKRNPFISIFFFFLFSFYFPGRAIYGKEKSKDPFKWSLPIEFMEEGQEAEVLEAVGIEEVIELPVLTIEGVLWGVDVPAVIIGGEIYKIGDTLKNLKAEIYKIEEDSVFILYRGKMFTKGIEKKSYKVDIK
ncbi:MAG: hypothetical protein KKC11_09225 [Candidatus Omnitrophica bacterium]|nr:hypothetical protein [Candidatus Omnitrophota bacterium]MBU0878159.1 hypothetical protein [Candidatus Omnitrophota bacterium]MBU1134633.1 hypothetical protein [Candidatus Omnitrophota bacterium]MBU1810972.1 hypothetical protein [Candidatus Omnitrophota bacterium]